MKRRTVISIIAAAGLLLSGCYKGSYEGIENREEEVDNTPLLPVWITLGDMPLAEEDDPQRLHASKGTGLVGDLESFSEKTFHVYAFNQDVTTEFGPTHEEDGLSCLVDGTIDAPGTKAGRLARWDRTEQRVKWVNGGDIYWPRVTGQGYIYDFFAYYIDDIELTEEDYHRGSESLVLDIEIDGSQDVMSSRAVTPEDKLLAICPDEKDRIYLQHYCYSYYSALNNVQPEFIFKHHLVKLDFKLVPGGTPGMTKDVKVEKIEVLSRNKAEFTVADKNRGATLGLHFPEEYEPVRLPLKEADGSEFVQRTMSTFDGMNVKDGTIEDLGSFLVAPGDEYYLYVTLGEIQKTMVGGEEHEVILDSKENDLHIYQGTKDDKIPFEAGNEYLITLTIYGQMDIRVATQLGEWGEGGDYDYDHDDANRPGGGSQTEDDETAPDDGTEDETEN